MKKILLILFCVCLTSCSIKASPKLQGSYVSDMISNLDNGKSGQLQLSFDEEGNVYYCVSSECKNTYHYRQDVTYKEVYYLQIENEEIMLVLQDDNSFYVPYDNGVFAQNAIRMTFLSKSIMKSNTLE